MTVGIVGFGREGRWWSKFLKRQGHTILTADNETEVSALISQVQIVILSVPMSVAHYTARVVGNTVRSHQLVISACGVMVQVENAFKNAGLMNALLVHRMVGPQVETMKGHPLHVHEVGVGPKWRDFVDTLILQLGGTTFTTAPALHDWSVGFTQAMIRVFLLSVGKIVLENPTFIQNFSNVPFNGVLLALKRVLDFGPELSWDMIHSNTFSPEWILTVHETMKATEHSSREDFEVLFGELQNLFGKDQVQSGSLALLRVLGSLEYASSPHPEI